MIMGSAAALGVALPGVEDNLLPEPTVEKKYQLHSNGWGWAREAGGPIFQSIHSLYWPSVWKRGEVGGGDTQGWEEATPNPS